MIRLELDPAPIDTPRALFDLSRLWRARARAIPTGVDRIDLRLALDITARLGAACRFVVAAPGGPALLSREAGRRLLAALENRWALNRAARPPAQTLAAAAIAAGQARAAIGGLRALATPETTYVNASHSGLPLKPGALDGIDPERAMRRLVYVHDLIPLEYPEYQTARSVARFARMLEELAARPTRFLTNSADTARRLSAYAAERGWPVESVSPLIPRARPGPAENAPPALGPAVRAFLDAPRPFFVALGTIEPRKNHLLLLQLWRAFAAESAAPPRLAIIGRRGWENEMVVDMLERCAAIAPHVTEFPDLTDAEAQTLLAGARALLFPSFAEGLGLPLMEAGMHGTPAVVSDLPALREIAPAGATFLDPLDGPGWARAIRALAA